MATCKNQTDTPESNKVETQLCASDFIGGVACLLAATVPKQLVHANTSTSAGNGALVKTFIGVLHS